MRVHEWDVFRRNGRYVGTCHAPTYREAKRVAANFFGSDWTYRVTMRKGN